jgi:hypothetical protein
MPTVIPSTIKIIAIEHIGLGTEPYKGSTEAYFPATIKWCDPDVDTHIAQVSPELVHNLEVYIKSASRGISPGLYTKIPTIDVPRIVFEEA